MNGFVKTLLTRLGSQEENMAALCLFDGTALQTVSAHAFRQEVLRIAGGLRGRGITGRHIVLAGRTGYPWLTMFCGILASGNVAVPLNPDLPEALLREACMQADADYGWSDAGGMDGIPEVRWLFREELLQEDPLPEAAVYAAAADEPVLLLGTSGTTGASKLAVLTDGNLCGSFAAQQAYLEHAGMTRNMLSMPLHHIGGISCALLSLLNGRILCVGRGVRYLFHDIQILQPAYLSLVPSMLDSLVKLLKRNPEPAQREKILGKHLRRVFVGGAAARQDACKYLLEQGIGVDTGYAMTETTGVGTWCALQPERLNTVGKPCSGIRLRIRDGEVLLAGPCVMQGYYKDPETTAEVLRDGWLHTGDLGFCDPEGFCHITGRKKNVIILSGGENVNPEEIEKAFLTCPEIRECCVYADGRGICAEVYTPDPEAAEAFIRRYNDEMPGYRQVYRVIYFDRPLEKTDSGKIRRKGQ